MKIIKDFKKAKEKLNRDWFQNPKNQVPTRQAADSFGIKDNANIVEMKEKDGTYRIRFNEKQIDALLSVASVLDNKLLGGDTIANFGYIIYKLSKIKQDRGKK